MNDLNDLAVPYNPNLLVTYKKIAGTYAEPETPEYVTEKINEVELQLSEARSIFAKHSSLSSKVSQLEDLLVELYNPNDTKEEALQQIIDLFGFSLTKEVEVQGTVSFTGTITVPLSEFEDFDLSNVSIDAEINSYDYDADLNVDDVSLEHSY